MSGLWRDRRANVAVVMGLLAVPLLGGVSLAIDFGNATAARARLDAAADSAALLATTVASNQFQAGASNAAASGQAAAAQRFNAAAGTIAQVTLSAVNVAVTQSGSTFTANVSYAGGYQTMLGKIAGVGSIGLHGASGSSLAVSPYVDIQVLMDVSSSMTIAATQNDINTLQILTAAYNPPGVLPGNVVKGEPCGFACHWSPATTDYLGLARANGVVLRIDVLSAAVGNLITTIIGLNKNSDFRLGLTTFAQQFTQIYPTSTNIAAATAALALIAPDINDCSSNCPETYFDNAMTSLGGITTASGNGASQATSQKFLFIVTDGLVDQYSGGNRVIGPVTPSSCNALKSIGVTILTLYTPYTPLPVNGFYNQYVAPIQSQIGPQLQACASSPNYAFQATAANQIDTQLQAMLAAVLQTSGHLTQ